MKRILLVISIILFAVNLTIITSPAHAQSYTSTPNLSVPDGSCPTKVSTTINVSDPGIVTSVGISVLTSILGDDMDIYLTSPAGTTVQMHSGTMQDPKNSDFSASGLTAWNGEPASGIWTLSACDKIQILFGKIDSWTLSITSNGSSGCQISTDGRLNYCDAGQTAAVYCATDGTVTVLAIWKGEGFPGIVATKAEIDAVPLHPAKNTLIKEGNGVRLYRLTSGRLQVNRASEKGKDYSFRFTCGS